MSERTNILMGMPNLEYIMSEGNRGGLRTLMDLMRACDPHQYQGILLDLDDMNMRGAQLWAAYSQHFDCDIHRFLNAIQDRDPAMVAFVNDFAPRGDYRHKAVCRGGSSKREYLSF